MQGWVQVNDGAKGLAKKRFQDIGLKFEKTSLSKVSQLFLAGHMRRGQNGCRI